MEKFQQLTFMIPHFTFYTTQHFHIPSKRKDKKKGNS